MRIITYNIRGALGMDNRRSLRRIADVIRAAEPDVACLQEVHRRLPWGGLEDQPARLADLTGMTPVFQNNLRVPSGQYGNLILSRMPVVRHVEFGLPNGRERKARPALQTERRGLLEAVVSGPGGQVTVLTTHWSLDAGDRLKSAEIVAGRAAAVEAPVVLTGDLNAAPESAEITALADISGMVDAAGAGGLPTFPSDAPAVRIDYVWLSAGATPTRVQVLDSQASDHRPLLVEW